MTRENKWENYFLKKGTDFNHFWKDYLANGRRDVLFVVGLGFDPRMNVTIRNLYKLGGCGLRDCLVINFNEGSNSPSVRYRDRVEANQKALETLMSDRGGLSFVEIEMWKEGRQVGSRNAAKMFSKQEQLSQYTDVIIDISSMPRSIYLPLIAKVLRLLESMNKSATRIYNLHVTVAENPLLDAKIQDEGLAEEADYIPGFSSDFNLEATEHVPRIWIPILGENQYDQIKRIHHLVNPTEVCPVVPFPSLVPRRGDLLILEYRDLLFQEFKIEPKNIVYADETNPFEVYRQISRIYRSYTNALSLLDGCKVAVSSLSSKLLSLGALLAACELPIGIAHIEPQGYTLPEEDEVIKLLNQEVLYELWIEGEPYAN